MRVDDTPEVLTKRLASYRSLTEPLIYYYSERRKLLTVDGMMTIEHVTREINRILTAIGAVGARNGKKAGSAKRGAAGRLAAGKASKSPRRGTNASRNGAKAPGRADKPASRGSKKPSRKASARVAGEGCRQGRARPAKKANKKVTKKRAKA